MHPLLLLVILLLVVTRGNGFVILIYLAIAGAMLYGFGLLLLAMVQFVFTMLFGG